MRLRCASCELRMDSRYFHVGEKNNLTGLSSICAICKQGGIAEQNYSNPIIFDVSKIAGCEFFGKNIKNNQKESVEINQVIFASKCPTKYLENLISSYDTNELVQTQISQEIFNQKMFMLITGESFAKLTGDFKKDLELIGFHINYDLNDLDFISREMVRREFNHVCQYCGREGNSVDHMNPVSLSADNSIGNLTLSCAECNEIKGNMPYNLFKSLNDKLTTINAQLVEYEQLTKAMQAEFTKRRNLLIVKTHLKNVVNDPELNAIRKENKKFQDALDSLNSDYLDLRNTRRKYFESNFKLDKLTNRESLI